MPPGGPVDTTAPNVIAVTPDSGSVNAKPGDVVFKFDETVAERPSAAPTLGDLFLVSPRDGAPNVGWHRGEVSVKPRRGWKSNTAYTITMLPGITDLRGNVRNTGKVIVFSTGPTIPTSRLSGTIFNWVSGSIAQKALVEARPATDTTIDFVAAGDSVGQFVFSNLPPGSYRVRGIIDDNNNKGLDPREAWDTTTVTLADSARVELFAFAHDSVAPRLTEVAMRDSATLELLFDRAIDPNQQLTPNIIDIKRADSTVVQVLSVAKGGATGDTTAAPTPRPLRPTPSTSLLVKLAVPLHQATTLRVRAINIRSLDGIAKTTERTARVDPNPPPAPPPAKVPPPGAPAPNSTTPKRPAPPPPPPPPPPAALPHRE